jgi:hypothetical protein
MYENFDVHKQWYWVVKQVLNFVQLHMSRSSNIWDVVLNQTEFRKKLRAHLFWELFATFSLFQSLL